MIDIITNEHSLPKANHPINKYWVLPHASKQFNTDHHLWANRSSPIHHTSVINLATKPRQRDNYKWTQIIQSESPHNQLLTSIIWKFKKLSDTTWLQKMQHKSSLGCTQVITNKSDMFNPLGYETTWKKLLQINTY